MSSKELFRHIDLVNTILITSHYNPDPDAVGSSLGLYVALKTKYPQKQIRVVIDGSVGEYADTLIYREVIENAKPSLVIQEFCPELVIFTDASGFSRFELEGGEAMEKAISITHSIVVGIDHHEEVEGWREYCTWYHNTLSSSASEDVAALLLENKYVLSKDNLLIFLVGMIADTGRFLYPNTNYKQTLHVLDAIYQSGLQIQDANRLLENITPFHLQITAEFIKNLDTHTTYNITYLCDEFVKAQCIQKGLTEELREGTHIFINQYLRQACGTQFGVAIFLHPQKPGYYKGSFRSDGATDCNKIARQLGGGGHKGAAAFELLANSIDEAILIVKKAIEKNKK